MGGQSAAHAVAQEIQSGMPRFIDLPARGTDKPSLFRRVLRGSAQMVVDKLNPTPVSVRLPAAAAGRSVLDREYNALLADPQRAAQVILDKVKKASCSHRPKTHSGAPLDLRVWPAAKRSPRSNESDRAAAAAAAN